MQLPFILNIPPGDGGMNQWLFQHAQDHLAIVQGVLQRFNTVLPVYVLDPVMPQDMEGWLLRHQEAHNDMSGVLGLQGIDLQTVDFTNPGQLQAWLFLNWDAHNSAARLLSLT